MAILRKDVLAHLEQNVRTGALIGKKDYTPLRGAFTREFPSDGAYETYADMGSPPWPTQNAGKAGDGGKDERTHAPRAGRLSGGRQITILGGEERALTVTNLDWEVAIGITHNAINDNRAGDLENWARDAITQFERHKDFECFNALNSGGAVSGYGACYDGLSFFNDGHVDKGAEYQTGQDNAFALVLSLDNYETVKVAGSKFKDGRGQPVGLNHSLLLVPPDLERTAFQIARNHQAYDTNNREANPYAGATKLLVAPGGWLDSTAWFVVDDSLPNQKPLGIQVRQEPELVMWDDENAGDGGIRYYKFHARYTVFFGDWRLAVQGNT